MTDSIQTGTIMSIDPKKHRIRIYKSTLHALGDPMYIQLLVSTTRRIVAVKCVDKVMSGDQSYRVNSEMLGPDNSCEIYSNSFIKELCGVVGGLEANVSYVRKNNRNATYGGICNGYHPTSGKLRICL